MRDLSFTRPDLCSIRAATEQGQQLALLLSAAQAAARPTASRPGAPDGRSLAGRRASEK